MGSYFRAFERRILAGCLAVMALVAVLFISVVDLRPQVTPDFFFGSNDPDLAQSAEIRALFPSDDFLVISVASDNIFSPAYLARLQILSANLQKIPGVNRLVSVTGGPGSIEVALNSPFWKPLLISDDEMATLIIAFTDRQVPDSLISDVEDAARIFDEGTAFRISLSGMPYIVEHIRRSLISDIKVFSGAALAVFTVILLFIFRSYVIALGSALSGITAVFLTLLVQHFLGMSVGILTANLSIIVFVLVQSQIIYLTSNWRGRSETGRIEAVRGALLQTFQASMWCMLTTLLGFATLLLVSAEPLRQLGAGGIIGAVSALICSFLLFPVFLLFARRRPSHTTPAPAISAPSLPVKLGRNGAALLLIVIVIAAFPGLSRLNTDPSLLSYFEEETELRDGLEFVDQNGGSSPAELVVRRPDDARLDTEEGYEAMWELHNSLLAHEEVGTVISLPALMAEANNHPLAFLLPWREIISLLSMDINERVAESFLDEGRTRTLFVLRMREDGRAQDRTAVMAEINEIVGAAGFETSLMGGVYVLQGRLSDLVATSLLSGAAGLLALFAVIAWITSRSRGMTVAMVTTAALVPIVILGGAGWGAVPIDVISAPAVNVCLGIAVDALIHLAMAVRARGKSGAGAANAWALALQGQTRGILASTGIIAIGFLIFAYSGFPPTARFGGAIVVGALFAGIAALTLFPALSKICQKVMGR